MSKICIIESDKITVGSNLMQENTDLVEWNSDLSKLINGEYMFKDCSALTTFTSNLSSLKYGSYMFNGCDSLTDFTTNLGSLVTGYATFSNCSNLATFTSNLGSLTSSSSMFSKCTNLTTFNCNDLSSLRYGDAMFDGCTNLTTFTLDLGSLESGYIMFYGCSSLTTFNSNLSSLVNGRDMFNQCKNLTTCNCGDLSSLENGQYMFNNCLKLTTFNSDLSSLTKGDNMFWGCNLDAPSVKNIALTINNTVTNNPTIHLGVANSNDEQVKRDLGLIKYKGWNLYVNGSNDTSTYTLPKFAGCEEGNEVEAIDAEYQTTYIVDGVWGEHMPDLKIAGRKMSEYSYQNFFGTLGKGKLTEFRADLSSLEDGSSFFYGCTKLTSFITSKLDKLWMTAYMFDQTGLTSFNYDLPAVTHCYYMFEKCGKLTSFKGTLKNAIRANHMFYMCNNFVNFESDLSSLTNGYYMFKGCSLSTNSLKNIAATIKDVRELTNGTSTSSDVYKQIHIGTYSSTLNEEDIAALNAIYAKGWSVYVLADEYIPSSVEEAQLDNENIVASPYYAKPIPVLEEDAEYIDENGNFFIIAGGHHIFVDDPETYGIFANEDDAAANMRLTKIER